MRKFLLPPSLLRFYLKSLSFRLFCQNTAKTTPTLAPIIGPKTIPMETSPIVFPNTAPKAAPNPAPIANPIQSFKLYTLQNYENSQSCMK